MAVAEILRAQSGNYEATGTYSFEFRQAGSASIFPGGPSTQSVEIPLLLPPGSVSYTEPQRSSLLKTFGSGVNCDFGNDFKGIDISGQCHFYYAGTTSGNVEGASLNETNLIDGYTEFLKLRWMLVRYRDFTMTANGRIMDAFPILPSLTNFAGFVAAVFARIGDGRGTLSDEIEVIWHDYDEANHFKVRVDTFSSAHASDDPWTIKYTIKLETYQTESSAGRNVRLFQPTTRRVSSLEQVRKVVFFTGSVAPDSQPDELVVSVDSGSPLLTNASVRQSVADTTNYNVGVPA